MLVMAANVLFAIVVLAVLFVIGFGFLSAVGWKKTVPGSIAWGFITVIAVFQVIAYPLYMAKSSLCAGMVV